MISFSDRSSEGVPLSDSSVPSWSPQRLASHYAPHVLIFGLTLIAVLLVSRFGMEVAIIPVAAMAVVAMFVRPEIATLLVIFAIYSNTPALATKFHGVPFIAAAAVPLLLLIPIGFRVVLRREPIFVSRILWLIFAFSLIQVVGALNSVRPELSLRPALLAVLEGFVLYVLISNAVRSPEQLRQVVWVLIAVGATLGALGLYQRVTGTYGNDYGGYAQIDKNAQEQLVLDPTFQPRQAGNIGVENRYAHMMLLLVPLGLLLLQYEKDHWLRLALAVGTTLIAVGIALTYSRGALIAFSCTVVAMLMMRLVRWKHVLGAAVVVALILSAFPAYRERLVRLTGLVGVFSDDVRTTAVASDSAITGRLNEATTAALVFADHPIVGVGPSMFPYHYEQYSANAGFGQHEGQRMAHNLYLGLAAEHGILGLGVMLAIFAVTLHELFRAHRKWLGSDPLRSNLAAGFFLVVLTYMAVGMFTDFSYVRYFWLMMALAAVAGRESQIVEDPVTHAEGQAMGSSP